MASTIVHGEPPAAMAEDRVEPTPARSGVGLRAVEAVSLAVAPVVAFFVLRVQPMATVNSIDPTLYTAYMQQGRDLLERLGPNHYFWARVGMTIPGRAAYLLFGAVGGFYALRYAFALLAIVPAYVLFKRLHSRSAGALAVAVILTSPVVLRAWGTDYPDGAAIAYLIAGTCCLLMPAKSRWLRLALAGGLLTLAVHCNVACSAVIGALVVSYALVTWRRGWRAVGAELAVLALMAVAVTGAVMVLAHFVFGTGNILEPTRLEIQDLRAGGAKPFHSTTWRWVLRETHLFVIPLLLVAWLALRYRRLREVPDAERVVVLSVALSAAAFAYMQFFAFGSTLEDYLYVSQLWAGVLLLLAFVLCAAWEGLRRRPSLAAVVGLVVAVPFVFHLVAPHLEFSAWPWAPVLIAGVALAGVVAAAGDNRGRLTPSRRAAGAVLVSVAVLCSAFALTVGKRQGLPFLPGQAAILQASYGTVLFNPDHRFVDFYRNATDLRADVPTFGDGHQTLEMWWPGTASDMVQVAGAMYLWRFSAVMGFDYTAKGLPVLTRPQAVPLVAHPPDYMLLLSDTGDEFDAGTAVLRTEGLEPTTRWEHTYKHGDVVLHARLLELGAAS